LQPNWIIDSLAEAGINTAKVQMVIDGAADRLI